ncbi:NAD(P)H-hydrate dehydratase [Calidithermus roseus]|uniref:Bifunctional NAD(P)H-hydrate repair enzyme n=1 Tax=Calidithermus roseus TaxID=1644118 RepID=A0A399EWR4_9DEIN|nr:NAD(P)H-hydrate dehydratase [Calidithermus roseus]RIH86962.1 Bifunctional NAD(P)H-hydrate repair enzyme Nnr [Calidithermus roseus]
MRLFTSQRMRQADATAVGLGFPSLLLMEAAGRAVAEWVLERFPGRPVAVLCGRGNNGGDGLVAARHLMLAGARVRVFAAEGHSGDAAQMQRALQAHALEPRPLEQWQPQPGEVIVDALFGTGLNRRLEGSWAELVGRINASSCPVVAVDLPSGLPFEPHVRAHSTLVLAALKSEHLFYPWREACGRIVLAGIGMPERSLFQPDLPELLTPQAMAALLPRRSGDAHKGSVGRVLIAGGYANYTGAPALAALGAHRAGAGLVSVAYPAGLELHLPLESVRYPQEHWSPEGLSHVRAEAAAVGMGAGPQAEPAAQAVLSRRIPTVLDADALQPGIVESYARAGTPAVITPHPGEAARLLGSEAASIAASPLEAARTLAERFAGVTVVLKGGPTVLARQRGSGVELAVGTTGNPAMASGGMGDVLSGVIAALLAAGLEPWDAARLGVYLHGLSGDRRGQVGLLAHDLAEELPQARAALERGEVRAFWEWR